MDAKPGACSMPHSIDMYKYLLSTNYNHSRIELIFTEKKVVTQCCEWFKNPLSDSVCTAICSEDTELLRVLTKKMPSCCNVGGMFIG